MATTAQPRNRFPSLPAEPNGPSPSQGRGTVLVVDDVETIGRLVTKALRRAGFAVLSARSLEEALRRIEATGQEPTVLLTDVCMPGHGGPAVSAALTERNHELRTVYMSGAPPEETGIAAAMRPGSSFLPKPFSTTQLVRAVEWALQAAGPLALTACGAGA